MSCLSVAFVLAVSGDWTVLLACVDGTFVALLRVASARVTCCLNSFSPIIQLWPDSL